MEANKRLKIEIELHFVGDGRTFLNFWNWLDGNDVIAEMKEGKLYEDEKEISLQEFTDKIRDRFKRSNDRA